MTTQDKHINTAPDEITFILPKSGKTVVMTMPNWGLTKTVRSAKKSMGLDDTDAGIFLLSQIITIDGEKINYEQFDALSYPDVAEMVAKWSEFSSEAEGQGNE